MRIMEALNSDTGEAKVKRETRQRVLRVSAVAFLLGVAFVGESFAAEKVPDNMITLNIE